MAIPDETMDRAAHATREAETENIVERCDCDTCMAQRVAGLNAALPVLRDAIRAELVQEMADKIDAYIRVGAEHYGEESYMKPYMGGGMYLQWRNWISAHGTQAESDPQP